MENSASRFALGALLRADMPAKVLKECSLMDYSWSQPHQCPVLGLHPECSEKCVSHAVIQQRTQQVHPQLLVSVAFLLLSCQGNASQESFSFAALPRCKFKIDFVLDTISTFPAFSWTLMFKYLQFLGFVPVFNTDIYSTCLLAFSKHNIAKWFSNCSSALHPHDL